jgi:uncharacterized protein
MNPLDIIYAHYHPDAAVTQILLRHSEKVRDRAMAIAGKVPHLNPDVEFIVQAAMLHDIGIGETHSPKIHCHGDHPYIRHGIIGRQILERHRLIQHALVCERHVGAGITRQEILARGMPLPPRDMLPITIEEVIICYADAFFSKTAGDNEHSPKAIIAELGRYGAAPVDRFMKWHTIFSV